MPCWFVVVKDETADMMQEARPMSQSLGDEPEKPMETEE